MQFTFNNTGVPDVDFQLEQIVAVGQGPSFNFGNFPLPSNLGGVKYVDSNDNGVRDPGEPPVGGVIITLTGTNDLGQNVVAQTNTAADGTYSFTGLRPGTYTVTETPPDNFITGMLNAPGTVNGVPTGMSVLVGVNPTFTFVVLPANSTGANYNFGELGLKPPFVSKRAFIVPEIPAPLVAVYDTTPVTPTVAASTTTAAKTTAPVKATTVAKTTTVKKDDQENPRPG